MDRRFNPLTPEEDIRIRKEMFAYFEANPGLPLSLSIRHARTSLRMTIDDLARFSKVSRRAILDIESERGNPTMATAVKLLRVFGLDLGVIRRSRTSG